MQQVQLSVTGDGGEVGRGGHGQHWGGDVFGFDPVHGQLVQVRRVHVLVVVPPEAVERDQQQLVPGLCLAQRLAGSAERRRDNQQELQLHLDPHAH